MKRPKIEDKEFKPIRNGEDYYQALEKYCDWLEGQPSWKALAEKTQQIKDLKYLLKLTQAWVGAKDLEKAIKQALK